MKRNLIGLAVGAAVLALAPTGARAADVFTDMMVCTGTGFDVCLSYTLTDNGGGNYTLTTTYASVTPNPGDTGFLTGTTIYNTSNSNSLVLTSVGTISTSGGQSWSFGCPGGLSGGGSNELEICGSSDSGVTNGIPLGGWVSFSFTSNQALTAAMFGEGGDLGLRGHIQSFNKAGCSLKPDSRLGVIADGVNDADCLGGNVVPEPITVTMLATGLLGLGGVGLRRRRKGLDVVNE